MDHALLNQIEDLALEAQADSCAPLAQQTLALVNALRTAWIEHANDQERIARNRESWQTAQAAVFELQGRIAALEAALPDPDALERIADALEGHGLLPNDLPTGQEPPAYLRGCAEEMRSVLSAGSY